MKNTFVEKHTFTQERKLSDSIAQCRYECEHCGHKEVMIKVDRMICSWCGHWVYKDEKAKFKYKMKEMMRNAQE